MNILKYRVLYLNGRYYPQFLTPSFWSFLGKKPVWKHFYWYGYDGCLIEDFETEEVATKYIKDHKDWLSKQGVCKTVREIPV